MNVPFSFRFIHAADLHLDSPFKVHLEKNRRLGEILKDATLGALTRLCDVAIQERVDFVVLAGDIYDGIQRGMRAQLHLQREILRLGAENIQVYLAYGNHDPVGGSRDLAISRPGNLVVFPTEPTTHRLSKGGVTYGEITGISYQARDEKRNLALMFPEAPPGVFSIAVLHGNVGGSTEHQSYAPASLDDLLAKGYSYWALGHIHKREVLSPDPLVIYPGNTQGLHMKPSERGVKGAELVEVTPNGVHHRFIPLAQIHFDQIKVDVTDEVSLDKLLIATISQISDRRDALGSKPLVARVEFVGALAGNLEEAFNVPKSIREELAGLAESLEPAVFVDEVLIRVKRSRTLEDLVGLSDVVGELVAVIRDWEGNEQRLANFAPEYSSRIKIATTFRKNGISDITGYSGADLVAARDLLTELLDLEEPS